MPAERTRGSRRTEADGSQLVWTMPVRPSNGGGIAFTANMTPITFSDLPPLVDAPPGEFLLFPPSEELPAPRRSTHSKKKPENHIPRPPNAFILFRSSFIKAQHVSTEVETNHSTLSKIIGLTWQNLPDDERKVWHAKARDALEEHKRKFPTYSFKPHPSRNKGGGTSAEKRKVREVGPKDLKRCAKIAELLVEGMKGQELDAAIQEFDRHHVPEIITRFEAPITARMYRRSSSAPVPDTEHLHTSQAFLPPVSTVRPRKKMRAASSHPTRSSTPIPGSPLAGQMNDFTNTPSYVGYTPTKQELSPSLDFDSFSFDFTHPVPAFECDPLSKNTSTCEGNTFRQTIFAPELTIGAPFMDDWTQCSSSVSQNYLINPPPNTPSYFTFDAQNSKSPFPEFASRFDPDPIFADRHHGEASVYGNDACVLGSPSVFAAFEHNHPEAQFADLDTEFSAFMSSIQQYCI